jgi:dihydroorotase-like cyclic amidohydrolase
VQTALSLLLTTGRLGLPDVSRLRTAAARLCGLNRKGALSPGFDADIVLVDIDSMWTVGVDTLHDRHRRSPFAGQVLRGVVVSTMVRGTVVYEAGGQADDPIGRFLTPQALETEAKQERTAV